MPASQAARIVCTLAALLLLASCATSPLGRRQLLMYDDATMSEMGLASFDQIKADMPVSTDAATNAYVRCVAEAILESMGPTPGAPERWEIVVFDEPTANAFALPGGKIGVHTGLLAVAEDQHQLATVIGHEIGHVLANHSNERMSQNVAAQMVMTGAGVAVSGGGVSTEEQAMLAALGLGMQYGALLPYSRTHESEADLIGLDLMAAAGFDPGASVTLWENMGRGGAQPPEFMSTHPSHGTRIRELQERLPSARVLEQQAHEAGRRPNCTR
jgi:predicted Zn-dependent protease